MEHQYARVGLNNGKIEPVSGRSGSKIAVEIKIRPQSNQVGSQKDMVELPTDKAQLQNCKVGRYYGDFGVLNDHVGWSKGYVGLSKVIVGLQNDQIGLQSGLEA